MAITFDLRDFNKRTTKILKDVPRKVAEPALAKTSKTIIQEAKAITPVDTGKLRNSLNYEIQGRGDEVTSIMGSDVEYAFIVHENLETFHANGQAKFLEKSLLRNIKTLENNIRDRMRRL